MKHHKLFSAISAGLLSSTLAFPLYAVASEPEATVEKPQAETDRKDDAEQSDKVEKITVTGSFIPREEYSEMMPVKVITAEEMKQNGLFTLEDVVESMVENSGYSEGSAGNILSGFTTGAAEANFRGLGAGRTLVLLNGRRIADYPLPFGGEQNGVDLGAIPFNAIAQIEYLSSGASAIYGSDAIGGVMNIITKRDMEQTIANIDMGASQGGTGQFSRASFISGKAFQKGSVTASLDVTKSEAVIAADVDFINENAPYDVAMASLSEITAASRWEPVPTDLPDGVCDRLGGTFEDDYCSSNMLEQISMSPEYEKIAAYLDGRYDITPDIELTANFLISDSTIVNSAPFLGWQGGLVYTDGGTPMDGRDDAGYRFSRIFTHDDLNPSGTEVEQTSWTFSTGAKGFFMVGDNQWIWDVAYTTSEYESTQSSFQLKEEGLVNWLFNGANSLEQLDSSGRVFLVDPDFFHNDLVNNVFRPVTDADRDSLAGTQVIKGYSDASNLSFTLSGELGDFGFTYNPVSFAVRAESSTQSTEIAPDQRTLNHDGHGWLNIGSVASKGERNRQALAVEFEVPVTADLDLSFATRYDSYDDDSSIDGRQTSQVKFAYKVSDVLKLRGGWAETFRAPDMFNIYGESRGYSGVEDLATDNENCFDDEGNYVCGFTGVTLTRTNDSELKEESGTDKSLGLVWTPFHNFNVAATWYALELNDLVMTESAQDLVNRQYSCKQEDGLDPASQTCTELDKMIVRNEFGAITEVQISPVNNDSMEQQGLDLVADFRYETETMGTFFSRFQYSQYLKFDLARYEGEAPVDLTYGEVGISTPPNSGALSVTWQKVLEGFEGVGLSLMVHRQGATKNFYHTQSLKPHYTTNLSGFYQFTPRLSAGFSIGNLFGNEPQLHEGPSWPKYWAHLQSPHGRTFNLSVSYNFL